VPKLARPVVGSNGQRYRRKRRCNHPADWMKVLPGTLTAVAMLIGAVTGLLRLFF
jgi:hypothetical protein